MFSLWVSLRIVFSSEFVGNFVGVVDVVVHAVVMNDVVVVGHVVVVMQQSFLFSRKMGFSLLCT